jgi:glycerophosphoryl diester phosphodiesterase
VAGAVVIGHRGSRATDPENSLRGFETAAATGVPAVELDVRLTADDLLVCSHDPTTKRLGGSDRPIAEMTGAEVREITLRGGVGVPTLAAVLDVLAGTVQVVIEVKNHQEEPGFSAERRQARVLADLLEARHGAGDRIRGVSSFDHESASVFAAASGRYGDRAAALGRPGALASALLAEGRRRDLRQLHPHYASVVAQPRIVAAAADAGVALTCWTVNTLAVGRRLSRLGVAGLISDVPQRLIAGLAS